jgi:hypothetical protein
MSVQVEVYGILELTLKATRFANTVLVALSVSAGCFPTVSYPLRPGKLISP